VPFVVKDINSVVIGCDKDLMTRRVNSHIVDK